MKLQQPVIWWHTINKIFHYWNTDLLILKWTTEYLNTIKRFDTALFELTSVNLILLKVGAIFSLCPDSEAVALWCYVKNMSWNISQNSHENMRARVSFLINAGLRPSTLLKKRLWRKCFLVNFAIFLRTSFFKRTPSVAPAADFDYNFITWRSFFVWFGCLVVNSFFIS